MLSGTYQWTNVYVGVRTFNGRLLTLQADVTCCRFYDGDAVATRVTLIFRPSTLFEINVGHEANAIDLPTGAVDIHLATADAVVNFTPDMQVALQGPVRQHQRKLRALDALSLEISPRQRASSSDSVSLRSYPTAASSARRRKPPSGWATRSVSSGTTRDEPEPQFGYDAVPHW